MQVRAGPWLVSISLPEMGASPDEADMDIDGPAPSAEDSPQDPTGDGLRHAVQMLRTVDGGACGSRLLMSPCCSPKPTPVGQSQFCIESPTLTNRAQERDLPVVAATSLNAAQGVCAVPFPSFNLQPVLVPHASITSQNAVVATPVFNAPGHSEPHTLGAVHRNSPGTSCTSPTPLAGDQPHLEPALKLATQDASTMMVGLAADSQSHQRGSTIKSAPTEPLILPPAPVMANANQDAVAAADVLVASGPRAQLENLSPDQSSANSGMVSGSTSTEVIPPAGAGSVQPELDLTMATRDAFIVINSMSTDCEDLATSTADEADVTLATRRAFATINDMFADHWDAPPSTTAEPTLTMATKDAFAAVNSVFQDHTTTSRPLSTLPFSASTAGPSCSSHARTLCSSMSSAPIYGSQGVTLATCNPIDPNNAMFSHALAGGPMPSQISVSPMSMRGSSLPLHNLLPTNPSSAVASSRSPAAHTPASPSTMTPPRQPPTLIAPALISGRNSLQPLQLLYPACSGLADTPPLGEPPLKLRRLDDANPARCPTTAAPRDMQDLGISDMWSDIAAIPVREDTCLLAHANVSLRPSPLQPLPVYEDTQLLGAGPIPPVVFGNPCASPQPPTMEKHALCGEAASQLGSDTTQFMSENLNAVRLGRHPLASAHPDTVNPSPMLFPVDVVHSTTRSSAALAVYEDTQLLDCPQVSPQPPSCPSEPLAVYEDTQLLSSPFPGSAMFTGHTGVLDSLCVYEDTQLLEPSKGTALETGLSDPPRAYEGTEFMAENLAPGLGPPCSPRVVHEVTRFMAENVAPAHSAGRSLTLDPASHCEADYQSRCRPLIVHEDRGFLAAKVSTVQCASTDSSPSSVSAPRVHIILLSLCLHVCK